MGNIRILILAILLAFASFRLTMIVTEDSIFEPVRRKICRGARPRTPRNWAANLITCPWCFGVWASFGLVALWAISDEWPGFIEFVLIALAVAGGQVIIGAMFHRLEGKVSTTIEVEQAKPDP